MGATKSLPEELASFINTEKWTYAKTIPKWPHEYLVREKVDETLFVKLAVFIRANGYVGRFYNKAITYYDYDGKVYWTMGAPIDETNIINRCQKEDSYESRQKNGTLPELKCGEGIFVKQSALAERECVLVVERISEGSLSRRRLESGSAGPSAARRARCRPASRSFTQCGSTGRSWPPTLPG